MTVELATIFSRFGTSFRGKRSANPLLFIEHRHS